ncbi:MAG: hypothetical protein HY289_16860 [Planctomycetes bacterium]|nr:hypothetical protein [Planctomycetota bacterium]
MSDTPNVLIKREAGDLAFNVGNLVRGALVNRAIEIALRGSSEPVIRVRSEHVETAMNDLEVLAKTVLEEYRASTKGNSDGPAAKVA